MTERSHIIEEGPRRCLYLPHDWRHDCKEECKPCLAKKVLEAREQAARLGELAQRHAKALKEIEAAMKADKGKRNE